MPNKEQFPYTLYLVISEEDCLGRDIVWVAEQAILGGVDVVQLREKRKGTADFIAVGQRLKALCNQYRVPLIINDNLDVAIAIQADGIHVGNSDVSPSVIRERWPDENKIVGYSIEYLEQLSNEEVAAADYLGISPVFKTDTKKDTVTEWGIEGVRTIRKRISKPLVAIGNLNASNAKDVAQAGADCIAVVSAICAATAPKAAATLIKAALSDKSRRKLTIKRTTNT